MLPKISTSTVPPIFAPASASQHGGADLHAGIALSSDTPVEELRRLKKKSVIAESFLQRLQRDPVATYHALEAKSTAVRIEKNQPILLRLLADLNERLVDDSVIHLPQFAVARDELVSLQSEAIDVFQNNVPEDRFSAFVIRYVETLDKLFRSQNPELTGTYHRDFAERLLSYVARTGDGTHAFYTFEAVDDLYFWDTRPAATYLHWLVDAPPFLHSAATYAGGRLVPTEGIQKYIDGLPLDLEEVTKHDFGHSFYMKRQDEWLFKTLNRPREELVAEWTETKNQYKKAWEILSTVDPELATSVRFLLSEIIHERGYQYFLPILRQQLLSKKWFGMLEFKRKNRYWGDHGMTDAEFNRLGDARAWLIELTESLLYQNNIQSIADLNATSQPVTVRQWHPLETHSGIPKRIELKEIQNIRVSFDVVGIPQKTTSLYEIALVLAPTAATPILTPDKIEAIEKWIWRKRHSNDVESLSLLADGTVEARLKPETELGTIPDVLPKEERFSKIELYKLERLLNLMRRQESTSFTETRSPDVLSGIVKAVDEEGGHIQFVEDSGRIHQLLLEKISLHRGTIAKPKPADKYINLNPDDRFVSEGALHEAYERYSGSLNPGTLPYVTISRTVTDRNTGEKNTYEFELGMVETGNPEIARAISSMLTRSLEDAKYTNGGYLPPDIVKRVQTELVSPYGVHNLWGQMGRRFVLSRPAGNGRREIIASALVGESRDDVFFFTSRFNNLKHSTLRRDVDFDVSADGDPSHRWFDKFNFPDVDRYKPKGYHHFANFVVERDGARGLGLSRLMIEAIVENYSRRYLTSTNALPPHSQRLLCGDGFWQIGDPPWLARMTSLGFMPRLGAESFHLDVDWMPLIPTYDLSGQVLDHVTYNRKFGVPQIYTDLLNGQPSPYRQLYEDVIRAKQSGAPLPPGDHMLERIPTVIKLATSGKAKIQYFQLIFPFEEYLEFGARRRVSG